MSPERWHAFCVNLHSRNECQDFASATFYGNVRKNAAPQNTDTHFACQDLARTTLCGNLQEKSRAQSENPDQEPAFTATVRTLQGGRTLWGKIKEQHQ